MYLNLYLLKIKIRKVTNIVFLYFFIMIGMLTSCSTYVTTPPISWTKAEPVLEKRCPDVTGVYQNQGIDAPGNKNEGVHQKYPQYLSDFLLSSPLVNGRKHKWITHVELHGVNQEKLIVITRKRYKEIAENTLRKNQDFTCTKQGIEINIGYMPSNPMGLSNRSINLIINKAIDGSLIVSEQESEAGLFVVIPYSESVKQYFRFPPMETLP